MWIYIPFGCKIWWEIRAMRTMLAAAQESSVQVYVCVQGNVMIPRSISMRFWHLHQKTDASYNGEQSAQTF